MHEQRTDAQANSSNGAKPEVGNNFEALYRKEQARLDAEPATEDVRVSPAGTAQEPRVTFTAKDRVGLALSGGGIRSATFNLGLLQGLRDMGVLELVHYLAMVSGGGYLGGWWQAWLRREKRTELFPKPVGGAPEAEEIRHLREFSNFLAPRWGFFETETWNAVVAIVSVVAPALGVAIAVMTAALLAWIGAAWVFSQWSPRVVLVGLPLGVAVVAECWWAMRGKADKAGKSVFLCLALTALALAVPWVVGGCCLSRRGGAPDWWSGIGISPAPFAPEFNAELFVPALVWAATAAPLLLLRLLLARCEGLRGAPKEHCAVGPFALAIAALDRVVQRLIGLALVWCAIGLLWFGGCFLQEFKIWLFSVMLAGGGGFAWLRNWIGGKLASDGKSALPAGVKAMLPQAIAYATVGLAIVLLAGLLAQSLGSDSRWWWIAAGSALVVLALALLLFDPTELAMHAFYRNRLVRAYLGASNFKPGATPDAGQNRQTDVRDADDLPLEFEPHPKPSPLHLVCCAANDVGGDGLPTLSRGSRSAVLSPLGFSMGDHWRPKTGLTLGSALTASAAAFNSNMGSVSMRLGKGVTFLMAALNLRLGLWVPNKAKTGALRKALPGLFFLREMLGMTMARPSDGYVHLSDGAHFENLALYELVRRHCRYIIVSDCGQDPTVAFDDFGNALRRIREDFGVEVEIDLKPLLPGPDGRARQHVAVGIIHYDSATSQGLDKGTLLYYKPALTGDEPPDVLQYKTRNDIFPHETTGDQFYDEAQWESYRRLGEHAARSSLRFLRANAPATATPTADAVFTGARFAWYPTPPGFSGNFIELTQRCADLESQLRHDGPPALTRQIFPELDAVAPRTPPAMLDAAAMETTVHILVQAIQLMEDVWFAAHLETHWNHPVNLGWVNYFQRWAAAPTFRMWWPVLKPQFNPDFRRFMEDRFQLPPTPAAVAPGALPKGAVGAAPAAGLAWNAWRQSKPGAALTGKEPRWLEIVLVDATQAPPKEHRIQAAIALIEKTGKAASWNADDLFVAPGLWGAGIGSQFVRRLLDELRTDGIETCTVLLDTTRRRTDLGGRQELVDHIDFYRAFGFTLQADAKTLRLKLS